ncbi:hypothetical protein NW757_012813 [Fusarium falciforme]|nr:hypothetical protein NW757_012813 [Fusarium falciforme]
MRAFSSLCSVRQGSKITSPSLQHFRKLATAGHVSSRAQLSRFEQDQYIDYADIANRIRLGRRVAGRALTYAEKIILAHTDNLEDEPLRRGKTRLKLRPRRIACQDATAQMALIQFLSAGLDSAAVPTTIHCDHLIVGKSGQDEDLPNALGAHKEVYEFMSSAAKRFNMGFWKPGAGIIHQTVLENYAFPGGMMVGTDSHTPNAGGMGMIAIGVGGADAVDVMADVINKLASILTVKGGTGSIVEFFGSGVQTLSATGMASITNMGAETGATTSIFPYSDAMSSYLRATGRHEIADAVKFAALELQADQGVEYDRIIDIDLSSLEPHINGPFTPDLSTPVSKFPDAVSRESWPRKLTAGLIGSCTNSSFQDMMRAATIARQALDAGLKPKMPLLISPGSEKTRETLKDSGVLDVFKELESILLTNACGPCCGSWDRQDIEKVSKTRKVSLSITNCAQGTENSIITSYNRNFTGRLDGNPATHIFLASPEMVMAKIFSDDLGFNPVTDTITTEDGNEFKFELPTGDALPPNGFSDADYVYTSPPSTGRESIQVQISDSSERLQRLSPFPPGPTSDPENCVILIKAQGKCTTDHITPAGPWFRFRGHLDNISNNTLIGAVNAENGKVNTVTNWLTGESGAVPQTARAYKQASQPWVVIGDHNYGEGSSREHAALQPRHLGCVAIIAKSFARIHETNLKKQGVLALTFSNEEDYSHINSSDRISIHGVADLEPGKPLTLRVVPITGKSEEWMTQVRHTMSLEEIEYFRAGSALNLMANRKKSTQSSPTL